ncbi:alpha/beta fold hydrolase [Olsenella uli]
MTIHEFGEENEGIIVLFHPLGVRWDVFNFVIPILREDYHLVIPAIPGFDPDAPEADFTSVEQVADEVAAWLVGHGFGHVTCLYGCSMGGAIVARMLAVGKAGADCAVMDGGMTPYRLWRPLTYLIGARDFAMMEIGKHMSVQALRGVFDPGKYTEDDLGYIKEAMHGMSAKTIWRSFYSCNNYPMPRPVPPVGCRVAYWYGSDERRARRWDIAYVREAFPCARIVENEGMGHAEFFTLHPEEFCERLTAWMRLPA